MRKFFLVALLLFTATFFGCSFSTDLVVINLSDKAVELRYQIRDYPGPFSPPVVPATKGSGEMDDDSMWHELSSDQYKVYPESRTVTVSVVPKTALLIGRVSGPGMPERAEAAASFPFTQITVVGAYGRMMLEGEQLRKSFGKESEKVYALTYK